MLDQLGAATTSPATLLAHCALVAVDSRAPLSALAEAMTQLFRGARCDILVATAAGRLQLLVSTEASAPAPDSALAEIATYAGWLRERKYRVVEQVPIGDIGDRTGWAVLALPAVPVDRSMRDALGYVARAVALRLRAARSEAELFDTRAALIKATARAAAARQLWKQATLAIGSVHNLGNTLALVGGLADLLQHTASPDLGRDLAQISAAVQEGGRIVDRVLKRRDVAAGAPGVRPLDQVVEEVVQLTRPMWQADANIDVVVDVPSELVVALDAAELREVLVNLVLNSVKAMPGGGTVTIRAAADGRDIRLEVSDTGVGIPAERLPSLFEPAADERTQERAFGPRGFGLPVSRILVEEAGGQISIQSESGRGTTVAVQLPVKTVTEAADDAGHSRWPAWDTAHDESRPG